MGMIIEYEDQSGIEAKLVKFSSFAELYEKCAKDIKLDACKETLRIEYACRSTSRPGADLFSVAVWSTDHVSSARCIGVVRLWNSTDAILGCVA